MAQDYEIRALKFAHTLVKFFMGCKQLEDFLYAIKYYNQSHSRKIKYEYGVSRIAIIRADYVIKFDMTPDGDWQDGRAGNCKSEEEIYNRACADGFGYLLAKTSVYTIDELTFSIMPRVYHVNDYSRDWTEHCTEEEADWLLENINDLHDGNIGYRNNKVCVIDYAWDATMW